MRTSLSITALILIPAFLLLSENVAWEKLSLRSIRKIGDKTGAASKLEELGYASERTYENFRYRQLILLLIFLALELTLSIFFNLSIATLLFMAFASIVLIVFLTEQSLTRELKRHRAGIESEFPIIVEALTLALSAGESPLTAMQRIAVRGKGSLSREFGKVIDSVREGEPFIVALDSMGRSVKSVAVRRFVDSIVIAITRGASLIDVLHGHAREARDNQRNQVLSAASKAELSMMIPVVFLILPISILFALWPSLSNLNLFAQG